MKGCRNTDNRVAMSIPYARIWSLTNRNLYFLEEWLVLGLKQRKYKVSLDYLVVQERNIMPKTNGDILKGQRS